MKTTDITKLVIKDIFDGPKVGQILQDIIKLMATKNMTVSEITALISNLCLFLGNIIEPEDLRTIDPQQLETMYYNDSSRVGLALFLQGTLSSAWLGSHLQVLIKQKAEKQEGEQGESDDD